MTRSYPDLRWSFLSFPGGAIASMRLVAENIFKHTPKEHSILPRSRKLNQRAIAS
ncbi:hypothetical protein [Coleofasciculus sp.]|uniref:hypothetical protein n=1 Tax=Coleofasciculus sp. TaxID=3100458 RepID=UPI0039F97963